MKAGGAKAVTALSLVAGLLLTCACMLFVCPVVASSPETCHSVPNDAPAPLECPFAVMQPVYATPLLDHDFGKGVHRAQVNIPIVSAAETESFALLHGPLTTSDPVSPPGSEIHARFCVFRI